MKREAGKRKQIIKKGYEEKDTEERNNFYEKYVKMLNEEDECIQQLDEKIDNHWGWKILNPNKQYVSRFDFL